METNSKSGAVMQVLQSYVAITDLKFGEMVVSDGVSVQTAPTAPHSFSRPAETCHQNKHHHPFPFTTSAF